MYDRACPVEIVTRPGPRLQDNPTWLRAKHRGERVLALPPGRYEVDKHGALATVY